MKLLSALDPISENLIKNALQKLMKGKTTIVIAHRLSTVLHADKICVVMNGKIIEEGTHKELIEKKVNMLIYMKNNLN